MLAPGLEPEVESELVLVHVPVVAASVGEPGAAGVEGDERALIAPAAETARGGEPGTARFRVTWAGEIRC